MRIPSIRLTILTAICLRVIRFIVRPSWTKDFVRQVHISERPEKYYTDDRSFSADPPHECFETLFVAFSLLFLWFIASRGQMVVALTNYWFFCLETAN